MDITIFKLVRKRYAIQDELQLQDFRLSLQPQPLSLVLQEHFKKTHQWSGVQSGSSLTISVCTFLGHPGHKQTSQVHLKFSPGLQLLRGGKVNVNRESYHGHLLARLGTGTLVFHYISRWRSLKMRWNFLYVLEEVWRQFWTFHSAWNQSLHDEWKWTGNLVSALCRFWKGVWIYQGVTMCWNIAGSGRFWGIEKSTLHLLSSFIKTLYLYICSSDQRLADRLQWSNGKLISVPAKICVYLSWRNFQRERENKEKIRNMYRQLELGSDRLLDRWSAGWVLRMWRSVQMERLNY